MAYGTALTVQAVQVTGLAPQYSAGAAQMNIPNNDGRIYLHVKNSGTQKTLTAKTPGKVGGLDIADLVITIPASTGEIITPTFAPSLFNDTDGAVHLDLAPDATGVTLAAIRH